MKLAKRKDIDLSKRRFMTLASTLAIGVGVSPLTALMLPDSAEASPSVPLRLYNPHTKERFDVDLFVGHRWNENALLVCHHLMRDWRQKKTVECDRKLFAALYVIQRKFNLDKPAILNSGYRTPETNRMLSDHGAAEHSQHLLGNAVDFAYEGVAPREVAAYVRTLQMGGVGNYATFTHMDTRGEPTFWGKTIA